MSSIREIADSYLRRVRPTGNQDVMAICPFHSKTDGTEERHPSFAMNVYSGLWYCHSCHARGNLYTFLRDIGMPPAEIQFRYQGLIEEAEKHSPPRPDPLNPIEPTKEPLEESFLGLFDLCPNKLVEEGYSPELLRRFDVGFDVKHNRITFPLRDRRGRLVGISGRSVLDNARPRYKVYDKEYLAFGLPERATDKRAILWNVHNVYTQFDFEPDPGQKFVVVCEGFKAVMRIAQSGVPVVGLLGSYLSFEQELLLGQMGCPILLMLDNNQAGRLGQRDAGNRLVKRTPRVWVVDYDGDQPSDLDPSLIPGALLRAQPFATWTIHNPIQH